MKLSKSLLGAIAVGVAMGSLTSCTNPTTDISDLNPDTTIDSRLERGEVVDGIDIDIDRTRYICPNPEGGGHGEDCPACGMG